MTVTTPPRIYVACLAAYNSGILHGKWIEVEGKDADDIYEEVKAMLATSPEPGAEEWAIHDHEGLGAVEEYDSFTRIAAIAEKVEEHGDAFLGWLDYENRDIDDFYRFEEQYRGEWESEKDYAYEDVDQIGFAGVPPTVSYGPSWQPIEIKIFDELSSYLDWDAIVTAMFQHGSLFSVKTPDYNVWVFDSEA